MRSFAESITELRENLVSAKAKLDQADMDHRTLRVRLRGMMVDAVQENDEPTLNDLVSMYMHAEQLRSENARLVDVTETYLELLQMLEDSRRDEIT